MITAEVMRMALEDQGHDVCGLATRASTAEVLIDNHDPDLVILDLKLTGTDMSGWDLAHSIRHRERTIAIVISANTDPQSKERLAQAGITEDRIFEKPFDEQLITEWVKQHATTL